MGIPYKYTSSRDYIESLKFDYVETYSFQRGADYEAKLQPMRIEYDRLSARERRRGDLTAAEKALLSDLHELVGHTQYLINEKGIFHPSCEKKNRFSREETVVDKLKAILSTEIRDVPHWLCAPVYRDAIVFYSPSGEIVSVLNVCLSCLYMETQMFSHINADYETYSLLAGFFVSIGHEIEQ